MKWETHANKDYETHRHVTIRGVGERIETICLRHLNENENILGVLFCFRTTWKRYN